MSRKMDYPRYTTYLRVGKSPSVLAQEYPRPSLQPNERYYPVNSTLERYFTTEQEIHRFGAESFIEFLADTMDVELNVVIPAIASLKRVPFIIPPEPAQDLYKTATDEGFHAEQSHQFLTDLRNRFGLQVTDPCRAPLFLRRLEFERSLEPNPMYRYLITILNGVVTETRISVELGTFAKNESLADSVREICRSHAQDEVIHSSQFRALGQWLWEEFDEDTKVAASKFLTASTIARSLPDVDRYADMLQRATGRSLKECARIVYSSYTEDILIDEMLIAGKPTLAFLKELGTEEYVSFSSALDQERKRLADEMQKRRRALDE